MPPAVISLLFAGFSLAAAPKTEDFCGEARPAADNFL
jgi:hypothetical protein